ncbi:MAG: hypothetical protein P1P86_16405 [Bacteroidales bacterium]|nr:hypothetical protein [Bacteroidales bacterium]
MTKTRGSDAAGLRWFGLNELPDLAFDHREIVSDVIRMIREGNQGSRD